MPRTRPPYPPEFRAQPVALHRAGRTPAELAKEFEPSGATIHTWIAQPALDERPPSAHARQDAALRTAIRTSHARSDGTYVAPLLLLDARWRAPQYGAAHGPARRRPTSPALPDPAGRPMTQQPLAEHGGTARDGRGLLDALFPVVYDELRRLAGAYLRRERPDHTLQPTALVHEAYFRLVGQRNVDWRNRAQFLGVAASMMRRVLVNYAEEHDAQKRGGGTTRVALEHTVEFLEAQNVDLLALDQALVALAAIDPRGSRIVELRFFGGLNVEETAEVIGVSPATVKRDWSLARAWLRRALATE